MGSSIPDFMILYYEDENIFRDADMGHIIYNIYEILTPSQIFLFRHSLEHNCFPTRYDRNVWCEIIVIPDETCGAQYEEEWPIDDDMVEDWGDDYERVGRYHRSKQGGVFR